MHDRILRRNRVLFLLRALEVTSFATASAIAVGTTAIADNVFVNSAFVVSASGFTALRFAVAVRDHSGVLLNGIKSLLSKFYSYPREQSIAVPANANYLLYLLLDKKDRQTIPGDLEEEFHTSILPKFGPRRAKLWYWSQTLTTIARCNPLIKWAFVGGGILKAFDWITRRISG